MPNADGLTDREAAIDAVMRFVCSLDAGLASLCTSSLTTDAVMDLTPLQAVGLNYDAVRGRDAIVTRLMDAVGTTLDTTHCATNVRCFVTGDEASLTCCVLAQHFRKGEGSDPVCQDYYLFGNQYRCGIVRDEGTGDGYWRIKTIRIEPAWTVGNLDVMKV